MSRQERFLYEPQFYPILIQERQGYLLVSQPDLGITHAETRFQDIQNAQEIGRIVLEVMHKSLRKMAQMKARGQTVPLPLHYSHLDITFKDDLLSPANVGAMLGLSKRTILRAIERNELPAVRTPGGFRRITHSDMLKYKETLGYNKKKRDSWIYQSLPLPPTCSNVEKNEIEKQQDSERASLLARDEAQ